MQNRLYVNDSEDSDESNVPTKQKQIKENKIVKKKIRTVQYSSEDSEESLKNDISLPKHPEMTENKVVKKKIRTAVQYSSEDSEESLKNDNSLPKHPEMTGSVNNLNVNRCTNTSREKNVTERTSSTSTHNSINKNDICLSSAPHSSTQNNCDKYFQEIIRQQSYFRTDLWQMADDLKKIKDTIINSDIIRQNQNGNKQQDVRSIYSVFDLPLKTVEEMEGEVEQFLQIPDNFERSITEACIIGGTSCYNFIKRNLSRLMNNELAQKYSWLGAKLKRKFCNLRIADMLITAGSAHSHLTYTKLELEKAIQKWLRRAKERYDAERKRSTLGTHENDV